MPRRGNEQHPDDHPHPEAGEEHDQRAAGCDQRCGAQVRLLCDQGRRHQDDEAEEQQVGPARRQRALVQVPGAHHGHGELHQLRRLEADGTQAEPALGPEARVTDDRDGEDEEDADGI